ncbi:hypothetical protein [Methanobrevibacter sp.]|uniref:hypothetical protein n=1 Tax=Methanobrevibacter sp. TaxID=66852 RepID=UPI00388DF7EF
MTKDGNIEENIRRVLNILFTLDELFSSTKSLCYVILWLLVDKFVGEIPLKNLLLDKLGGKMSAVYDYGQRKEENGRKEGFKEGFKEGYEVVILKLYENGMGIEISKNVGIDVKEIEKMLNQ